MTVDKATGQYTSIRRARSWSKALGAIVAATTARYGDGTKLRTGLLYGESQEEAQSLLKRLSANHPIGWHGLAPVGPALAVHTGPKAVGLVVAPQQWPWEH